MNKCKNCEIVEKKFTEFYQDLVYIVKSKHEMQIWLTNLEEECSKLRTRIEKATQVDQTYTEHQNQTEGLYIQGD